MAEFETEGTWYRTRLLNAVEQWRLLNRIQPLLPALARFEAGAADVRDLLTSLRPLLLSSDTQVSFVFRACLAACERQVDGQWQPIDEPPVINELVTLVIAVVAENFATFFGRERATYTPVTTVDGVKYTPALMPNGESWLYRPLTSTPPLCTLAQLLDNTYHIEDIALMNELLDLQDENARRAAKAVKAANG